MKTQYIANVELYSLKLGDAVLHLAPKPASKLDAEHQGRRLQST